ACRRGSGCPRSSNLRSPIIPAKAGIHGAAAPAHAAIFFPVCTVRLLGRIVRRRVIALKTARAERVADALERSLGRGAMSAARRWLGRRGADRAWRGARKHLVATQGVGLATGPAASRGVSR